MATKVMQTLARDGYDPELRRNTGRFLVETRENMITNGATTEEMMRLHRLEVMRRQ